MRASGEVLRLLQQHLVEMREGVVEDAAPCLSCRAGAGDKCVGHDGESMV